MGMAQDFFQSQRGSTSSPQHGRTLGKTIEIVTTFSTWEPGGLIVLILYLLMLKNATCDEFFGNCAVSMHPLISFLCYRCSHWTS